MKHINYLKPAAGALVLGWLVASGCSEASSDSEAKHAGHPHAQAERATERDPSRAWCTEHECYEDLCFICRPELREADRLWCGEHDCYEDRCWECHPDARDPSRPYCQAHRLYKDECHLCRPELRTRGVVGGGAGGLMCVEHGVPEEECGICHPELALSLAPGQGVKVRLPAAASAQIAGIELGTPTMGEVEESVECFAEMAFNQNQLAQVVVPVAGIIQAVDADLGDQVEERQILARIWSATIAEAVAKAVLTHQTLDRERTLRAERVTSEKDLQEAEAAHRAACQQLRTLGFTEEQIDVLSAKPQESVLLEVRAPFAGEIVDRTAVRGALIQSGMSLFTLVDRSTMWAMLNIPESALARVQVGQKVELGVDALPGRVFAGTLTWIAAEVEERTRLARARAEIANPDGLLRAKMFARARILTRQGTQALVIPASAIQQVEGTSLVFVKLEEDLFEARQVHLGARWNGLREVIAGLQAEDPVVIKRSYALKSQLLLSRLGAGCVDD